MKNKKTEVDTKDLEEPRLVSEDLLNVNEDQQASPQMRENEFLSPDQISKPSDDTTRNRDNYTAEKEKNIDDIMPQFSQRSSNIFKEKEEEKGVLSEPERIPLSEPENIPQSESEDIQKSKEDTKNSIPENTEKEKKKNEEKSPKEASGEITPHIVREDTQSDHNTIEAVPITEHKSFEQEEMIENDSKSEKSYSEEEIEGESYSITYF